MAKGKSVAYKNPFLDKELSWLAFNERVLQEAADKTVPVIERTRFLGIFSNNLDEFFRVRVAEVKRRAIIHGDDPEGRAAQELLKEIQAKALDLQKRFDETYSEILFVLARRNIFVINEDQLSEEQGRWLRKYFRDHIQTSLVPIFADTGTNLSQVLKEELTYLGIEICHGDGRWQYASLEIPSDEIPRFVRLPKQKDGRRKTLILLDNIIRYCLDDLFRGLISDAEFRAYAFKITRDAEVNISDEIDESLLELMTEGLKQRLTSAPVRFVHDREMPASMLHFFTRRLKISSYDSVIPGGRYHNFKDFMDFPAIGPKYLVNKKMPALNCPEFDGFDNPFDAIRVQDILLYYPYHKFRYFTEFVRYAACDPKVQRIKLSIYRVAKQSELVNSLIDATNNHKDVTVVVELRARFDEAANIEWAKTLTDAGVKVIFSVPSLKVHSKICLIERLEDGVMERYAHIGTGNFHEKTARIYTDFSLFTAHREIVAECDLVFDMIARPYRHPKFRHLIVSPHDTRKKIERLIQREIAAAGEGKKAEIFLKMNNLTDPEIIQKLYDASGAGVKIRLIIRGMCSLVPGVTSMSDNIKAISIVDRFLEHARVMVFHNNGDRSVFISSADLMPRNLDSRVEVGCPVYDEKLKRLILDIMEIQWKDVSKARILDKNMRNRYAPRGNRRKIRSQIAIHEYLKGLQA